MESDETYEHTIVVDEYTQVRLKIPKRLSAMALKALMTKATKLFNLSEVPIEVPRSTRVAFTPDMVTMIRQGIKHKSCKQIAEQLNKEFKTKWVEKQIKVKISNMKASNMAKNQLR